MVHEIRSSLHYPGSCFKVARWVTDQEADVLCHLIDTYDIEEVYESGTANGYSACRMAEAGVSVTTFDPYKRPHIWEVDRFKEYGDDVIYIEKGFETMELSPIEGHRLFFIDGEHDITNCRRDINTIFKYIQRGDVVAFHDYRERKVAKVINRINLEGYTFWVELTRRQIFVMVKDTDAIDAEVV